jgi:AcrR family transcriptional regulator
VRAKRMPKAERRAQLLSTAREIIQSGGIGALTMSALAEKSGASKPVVYDHFENSESVAIELLNEFYKNIIELSVERLVDPETIVDYFDIIVDLMFDYYYQERTLVRLITNGFSANSEVNAYYLEQQEHSHAVYKELLLQQGIPPQIAHVAAYALQEMIGSTVQEFAGADNQVERDTLKRLVGGVVHSLIPEQGTKPLLPRRLLDTISNAGEAHRHPRRPAKGSGMIHR